MFVCLCETFTYFPCIRIIVKDRAYSFRVGQDMPALQQIGRWWFYFFPKSEQIPVILGYLENN